MIIIDPEDIKGNIEKMIFLNEVKVKAYQDILETLKQEKKTYSKIQNEKSIIKFEAYLITTQILVNELKQIIEQ